ncbi:MAG: hypothetical protein R3A52_27280 [Polyangiales bacterium]
MRNKVDPSAVVFVPPPTVPAAGVPTRSTIEELTDDLVDDEGEQVYALSGQFGSGKSIALRQVQEDPRVKGRFQVVAVNTLDGLPPLDVDIRMVLLLIAESVARALAGPLRAATERLSFGGPDEVLREWIKLLAGSDTPSQPTNLADYAAKISLQVAELNFKVKNDDARRAELRSTAHSDVPALRRLTSALTAVGQRAAKELGFAGGLLVVMDDLDKFRDRSLFPLFERDISRLSSVPCKLVVTIPYYLSFESTFLTATASFRRYKILNAKIVTAAEPKSVLDAGRAFFITLYRQHADPALFSDGPDLAASPVFDQVVLLSAGIPREFFRVLHYAFDVCDYNGEAALTAEHVRAARVKFGQELIAASQRASTRGSLKVVRITKRLSNATEWTLLDSLQVVEYVNDRPWYSVHPALADWVGEQLVDDAASLGVWTRQNTAPTTGNETLAERMLRELKPEAIDRLVQRGHEESQRS